MLSELHLAKVERVLVGRWRGLGNQRWPTPERVEQIAENGDDQADAYTQLNRSKINKRIVETSQAKKVQSKY